MRNQQELVIFCGLVFYQFFKANDKVWILHDLLRCVLAVSEHGYDKIWKLEYLRHSPRIHHIVHIRGEHGVIRRQIPVLLYHQLATLVDV